MPALNLRAFIAKACAGFGVTAGINGHGRGLEALIANHALDGGILLQRDIAAEFHVYFEPGHFQPHFCWK
jgi:hypothetical protein